MSGSSLSIAEVPWLRRTALQLQCLKWKENLTNRGPSNESTCSASWPTTPLSTLCLVIPLMTYHLSAESLQWGVRDYLTVLKKRNYLALRLETADSPKTASLFWVWEERSFKFPMMGLKAVSKPPPPSPPQLWNTIERKFWMLVFPMV